MKQTAKHLILCTCAAILAGCAGISGSGVSLGVGLGGRHVGVGTSVHIPLGSQTGNQSAGGVNVLEEQIVTYFDTEGKAVSSAVKGGYHRKLLRKQGTDGYLVQDFYSSGEKRSDAMLLDRDNLYDFRAHPKSGVLTVYAINGSIMRQQNFRNGRAVAAP